MIRQKLFFKIKRIKKKKQPGKPLRKFFLTKAWQEWKGNEGKEKGKDEGETGRRMEGIGERMKKSGKKDEREGRK